MRATHTHRSTLVAAIQWTGDNLTAVEAWAQHNTTDAVSLVAAPQFPPRGSPLLVASRSVPGGDRTSPSSNPQCAWPGDWLVLTGDDQTPVVVPEDVFGRLYLPTHP